MYEEIKAQTKSAINELIEKSKLKSGDIVVVGCSSSEILGEHIGKGSSPEVGAAVAETILNVLSEHDLYLAFGTAVYDRLRDPVVVEHVKARAGLDIGYTLIGMHLRDVAVPIRLSVKKIGEAGLNAAYTRPKLIGGIRAHYPE